MYEQSGPSAASPAVASGRGSIVSQMGTSPSTGKSVKSSLRIYSRILVLLVVTSASVLTVSHFSKRYDLQVGSAVEHEVLSYLPPKESYFLASQNGVTNPQYQPEQQPVSTREVTNAMPHVENTDTFSPTTNDDDSRERLNVLILYPDDWRHDTLGVVAPVVQTPFLNRLAEQGIRFSHNMVTTSICWISRATLFTGMYATRHKSYRLLKPEFYKFWHNQTWPSLLREAGYFVGHIGKWQFHNPNKLVESFYDYANIFEGQHQYHIRTAAERARDLFDKFLIQKPDNMPFAATIAFYPPKAIGKSRVPGAQYHPKPETREKFYSNVTVPEPPYDVNASYYKLPWFFHTYGNDARRRWEERYQTSIQYQESMKNYYALVTEVDQACQEIVENLKRRNLLNTTMVIFTTDNGLFHAAHGLAGKWYPYQESIRVPLIVYDPRMPSKFIRTINDAITLNIDLAPTILGAAGIKAHQRMQGRDIADLYLDRDNPNFVANKSWRDEFYYEFPADNGKWVRSQLCP
jgi:arylsulfatase